MQEGNRMKLEKILEKIRVPRWILEAGLAFALLGGCSVDYVKLAQKEYSNSHNYKKAIDYCSEALNQNLSEDDAIEMHMLRGQCRLKNDYFAAGALEDFVAVLNCKTDAKTQMYAHFYVGQAKVGLNLVTEAIQEFNTALGLHPNKEWPELFFYRAIAKARCGLFEEALAEFNLVTNSSSYMGNHLLEKARIYKGAMLLGFGKTEEAAKELDSISSLYYPEWCVCHAIKCLAYAKLGNLEYLTYSVKDMLNIFSNNTIEINHEFPGILDILKKGAEKSSADEAGRSLGSIDDVKKYKQDLANYAEAVKQNPRDFAAYYSKAFTEQQLQMYKEAATDFEKVLELKSDYLDAEKRLRDCRERVK